MRGVRIDHNEQTKNERWNIWMPSLVKTDGAV